MAQAAVGHEGYREVKVPLSSLKNADGYAQIAITATIENATIFDDWGDIETQGDALILDNIRIVDLCQNDLAVAVSALPTVSAGKTATVTATVLALIFLTPLIVVSSPIWVPAGFVLFAAATAFLSLCGFGVCAVAGLAWMYRYFRGLHPPGAERVDYARSRIYDTASHVKDYAREYGGYLQTKVKDAAPGA